MKTQTEFIRFLQKSAHHLKPVVQIGKNSLTPGVIKEINEALNTHELIKVQFLPSQKLLISSICEDILAATNALFVKQQGNIITIFLAKTKDSAFIKE